MFFKRKPKTQTDNQNDEFQEIGEKRTSILGYVFLFLMALFIVIAGETIFNDLQEVPKRPGYVSYCLEAFAQRTEKEGGLEYVRDCDEFTELDQKYGLESKYYAIKSELDRIQAIDEKLNYLDGQKFQNTYNLDTASRDYDLSLQEKMAEVPSLVPINDTADNVSTIRATITNIETQITDLRAERTKLVRDIGPELEDLKFTYAEAKTEHRKQVAWFQFKVFLLQLLFVLPFFLVLIFYYLKLKRKDSPYTIILTSATGAFAVLFLQTTLVFLYHMLPTEWIEEVLRFLLDAPFLRYIIYYGSVILVLLLFGGVVYYIQKNVFSPAKVAMRRIKDNKCPDCAYRLNDQHSFCPRCGLKLKKNCESCGHLRFVHLPFCSTCGKR